MWAAGLIGSRSSLNRMSRRQPILSQYAPACPNSGGLGASYACDRGDADRADQCVGKREHNITRRHLAHEVVERVGCEIGLALGRPEIPAAHFMAVGLVLVHPPVAHLFERVGAAAVRSTLPPRAIFALSVPERCVQGRPRMRTTCTPGS